jgi:hypothetical protein
MATFLVLSKKRCGSCAVLAADAPRHSRSHPCVVRSLSHTRMRPAAGFMPEHCSRIFSLQASRTATALCYPFRMERPRHRQPRVDPEQLRANPRPTMRAPPMKHPDSNCDCTATASPLALRWGCSVCGKTAIMKVSTLAAICDGDTIRNVEPEVVSHQSTPGS